MNKKNKRKNTGASHNIKGSANDINVKNNKALNPMVKNLLLTAIVLCSLSQLLTQYSIITSLVQNVMLIAVIPITLYAFYLQFMK